MIIINVSGLIAYFTSSVSAQNLFTIDAEYEIIAVFLSRVYYKSEKNVFRYYYFINAENEQQFNEYVQNSKKASLYGIEATLSNIFSQ